MSIPFIERVLSESFGDNFLFLLFPFRTYPQACLIFIVAFYSIDDQECNHFSFLLNFISHSEVLNTYVPDFI